MKAGFLLSIIAVLAIGSAVEAESKINVNVNNTSETSTTNTGSSHSRVEITTNGETKVFESNGEEVDYQSADGTTSVRISSNGNSQVVQQGAQKTVNTVTQEIQGAVDEAKKEVEANAQKARDDAKQQIRDEVENQKKNILEKIKEFFVNLFSF